MFWIEWAWQSLLHRRRSFLPFLFFLSLINLISLFALMFMDGARIQIGQSVSALQGDVIVKGTSPSGLESKIIETANATADSLSLTNLQQELIARRQIYLVNGNGYFATECIGIGRTQPTDNSAFFSRISPFLTWIELDSQNFNTGGIYLTADIAERMEVHIGDMVSTYYETPEGKISSQTLEVRGLYVASSLLFEDMSFIDLQDLRDITLIPEFVSEVRFHLENDSDRALVWGLYNSLVYSLSDSAVVKAPILFPEENYVVQYFDYYLAFLIGVLLLFILVTQGITGLSLKNTIYLDFLRRRNELSTLKTFGMRNRDLHLLYSLQSMIIILLSLFIGLVSAGLLTVIASHLIVVTDIDLKELINVMGGPKPAFRLNLTSIVGYCTWITALLLIITLTSVNSYARKTIRSIVN